MLIKLGGSLWQMFSFMLPVLGFLGFAFADDPSSSSDGSKNTGGKSDGSGNTGDGSGGSGNTLTIEDIPDDLFQEIFNRGFKKASAQLEKKLNERLTEMGIDEEKLQYWQKLEKEKKELEQQKLHEKGEFEKLKEQLLKSHEEEKKKWQDQVQKQEQTIRELLINNAITSAAAKLNAYSTDQVVALLEKRFIVEFQDGRYVAVAVDSEGNKRYNKKGDLMTVEEVVKEYLEQNPNLVKANVQLGSGAQPGTGVRATQQRIESSIDAIKKGLAGK